MSKLDELMKELCPNGVEYKAIEAVTTMHRGVRVVKRNLEENGLYPVYQNSLTPLGYMKEKNCDAGTTFVISAGAAGEVGFSSIDFWAADDCYYFDNNEFLDGCYLYHVLLSKQCYLFSQVRKASIPRLGRGVIEKMMIPMPPIEVQREIVRILDKFTLLSSELTAELTARKKQYEYYKDNLLRFNISIPKVKIKDIATDIYRGSGITREQVTEDGIPCVRYGEIYTTYNIWFDECKSHTKIENIANPKYFDHGDILFAITGENVEDIAKSTAYVGNDKCLAGGDIVVLKHNQNPKYLSYVLSTHKAQQQKSKGKIKSKVVHSSVPAIGEIEIPLPKLEVQNRLVDVLDNFEAVCSNLDIALPAEIEARQKQYEYYWDMLLAFVESGENNPLQTELSAIKLLQYVFGYVCLPLNKICNSVSSGKAKTKSDNGIYPVYGSTGIIARTNSAVYRKKNILVARVGANAGYTHLAEGEYDVSDNTLIVDVMNEYNLKYIYYQLVNADLHRYAKGGGQPLITAGQIKQVILPIPSLKLQKKIVDILDHFDAICNDISEGLPAEIEARQKQYEYYRDKLLSFKEKTND